MKQKITITLVVLCSLIGAQPVYSGIFSFIGKALGIKEDSALGQIARAADEIGSAVVANKVNDAMTKYGSEQINSYNEWANQYNENQDRKVQKYLSEVDQFKMDYCKSHGFYDLWYKEYGEEWFEREGRSWFDGQDELSERRTGNRLLPWHLRDAEGVRERANASKIDGSLTNVILGGLGLSDQDARRGEQWSKSDKYGKQDIVIDYAFDVIGATTGNKEMLNAFRRMTKANNQYMKDKANAETSDVALSNMVSDLANIVYDAYEQGADRRKAYLREKLQIQKKLEEKGYNASFADEVAGTILSVYNNNDLTEHEKKEWLRLMGFFGEEESVLNEAAAVSQMTEGEANRLLDNETKRNKEKEEQERREREERERKERERSEAISTINTAFVDSYKIDEYELSDQQAESLVAIVEAMKNQEDLMLEIIGYTCDLGTEKVNEKIGMKRAEKVKEYLIDSGIAGERITVSTRGESEPVFENTSGQNRLKNRRVTFAAK